MLLPAARPGQALKARLPLWLLPVVAAALGGFLAALLWMLRMAVARDPSLGGVQLAVPQSWAQLREGATALRLVATHQRALFTCCLMVAYIFKQTFAVPGSFLLNALAGLALGPALALPLVTALSAAGATCGYLLSREFGGGLLARLGLEPRLGAMRAAVEGARASGDHASLALTLLSLRLFPASPHWAINALAPHAGVPLPHFVLTAAVGMAPFNGLAVVGGSMVATVEWGDIASWRVLGALAAVAAAVLGLSVLLRRGKRAGAALAGNSAVGAGGGVASRRPSRAPSPAGTPRTLSEERDPEVPLGHLLPSPPPAGSAAAAGSGDGGALVSPTGSHSGLRARGVEL